MFQFTILLKINPHPSVRKAGLNLWISRLFLPVRLLFVEIIGETLPGKGRSKEIFPASFSDRSGTLSPEFVQIFFLFCTNVIFFCTNSGSFSGIFFRKKAYFFISFSTGTVSGMAIRNEQRSDTA